MEFILIFQSSICNDPQLISDSDDDDEKIKVKNETSENITQVRKSSFFPKIECK